MPLKQFALKKIVIISLLTCLSTNVFSQVKPKKKSASGRIKIVNADDYIKDKKYPNVTIGLGNVFIEYKGGTLRCKKAYLYDDNRVKASGDVEMNQGDTIFQYSDYLLYNDNTKKAKSWGNVILKDPTMMLEADDTLYFDRIKQEVYYHNGATIKDSSSVLKSKKGTFYMQLNKFSAKNKVVVTNKNSKMVSNHLDYYTNTGEARIFGASTIYAKKDSVYTERGYYNTKTGISHLLKNSKIYYKNRVIEGDSLYNDSKKNFASATNHIKVTDTVNKSIVTGNYAEVFRLKDSLVITRKPMISVKVEKDSTYIHGKKIIVTGKENERFTRIYPKVKMFKIDMQGKCDSLVMSEKTGLTELLKKPVLWAQGNQMTGDKIHLISNTVTEKMDSLKVLGNGFLVQKDSAGFSQLKGKNMYGKFKNNELKTLDVVGNSEVVFYIRNDKKELVGITKMQSNKNIFITFLNKKIQTIDFIKKPSGKTYPPSKFDKKEALLTGFIWREEERPLTKEEIFKTDKIKAKKEKLKKSKGIEFKIPVDNEEEEIENTDEGEKKEGKENKEEKDKKETKGEK